MRRLWLSLGLVACFACDSPKAHDDHEKQGTPSASGSAHEEPHDEIPKRVSLTKEVIAAAAIKSEPARRAPIDAGIALPGEIVADPDRSARIASPAAGRLERVDFREGEVVKKGQVLATVRVPEIGRLRAGQAVAKAKGKAARANAKRLRQLVEKGLASEQQALDAESEADALEAEAAGLASQMGALGAGGASSVSLRAAVTGTVLSRDAVVGQPLGAEHTLGSIADLSEVWFVGRVFEKDLGKLRIGAKTDVVLNAYGKRSFSGVLEYIGQQVDPVARTLTARVRLKNVDSALRIGLFGNARVAAEGTEASESVLAVPHGALTDVGGKPVVFVQHGEGDFELHEVVLGRTGVGSTEVVSGLREGEQVVVEGVFSVKSALLRGTLAEEEH